MSADIPYIFDLERLLDPVSAERPSGESLHYEGTYDRIREARREDDPRMSRGIYESEPKRADWAAVESLATESLSTRTKDLQLAAWLTESWTHLYGRARRTCSSPHGSPNRGRTSTGSRARARACD
jgi:type VI secretion system protein ImpA